MTSRSTSKAPTSFAREYIFGRDTPNRISGFNIFERSHEYKEGKNLKKWVLFFCEFTFPCRPYQEAYHPFHQDRQGHPCFRQILHHRF
jgi:hypothetical protein